MYRLWYEKKWLYNDFIKEIHSLEIMFILHRQLNASTTIYYTPRLLYVYTNKNIYIYIMIENIYIL